MKRVVLLCIAVTMLQACKKESKKADDKKSDEVSITVTSSNQRIYYPGDLVTLTWKSENIPATALIAAQINNTFSGMVLSALHPEHDLHAWLSDATANDGEESFYLPSVAESEGVYNPFGKNFQIVLMVSDVKYPHRMLKVNASSKVFTVLASESTSAWLLTPYSKE